MFDQVSAGRNSRNRWGAPRIAALSISIVLHFLLVLWMMNFRWNVKFFDIDKQKVQNVMLGPHLVYPLPKIVGHPQEEKQVKEEPPEKAGGEDRDGGVGGAVPSGTGVPGKPGFPAESQPGPIDRGVMRSLADKFHESLAAVHKPAGTGGLSVTLGRSGQGLTGPEAPGPGGKGTYPPDLISGLPGPGVGSGLGGGGKGFRGSKWMQRPGKTPRNQVVGVSIPSSGINLGPWGVKVVDGIQKNWDLPRIGKFISPAKVSFIVLIKKNGEMDSMEILEVTSIEALDEAAMAAIRASLPFPALPDGFPGDLLEITFEFTYND